MIQTFIEEHSTRMKGLFRGLDIPSSFSFGFHVALNFHASLRRRLYCLLHLDVCHIVDTCTKARYIVLFCFIFILFISRVLHNHVYYYPTFWTHVIHKVGQTVETKHVVHITLYIHFTRIV